LRAGVVVSSSGLGHGNAFNGRVDRSRELKRISNDIQARVAAPKWNVRRIWAIVEIEADRRRIWDMLSNYERLPDFIPSLAATHVISRRSNGARISQVGKQEIGLGISFNASAVLDIKLIPNASQLGKGGELDADLNPQIIQTVYQQTLGPPIVKPKWDASSPSPTSLENANSNGSSRKSNNIATDGRSAITFDLVESRELVQFEGGWIMQEYFKNNRAHTRLVYVTVVKPQVFLPVQLIEKRIQNDVKTNLAAVKYTAELLHKQEAPFTSRSKLTPDTSDIPNRQARPA